MAVTKMSSYDLKGNKLSFANWVSNISPTETPFASMTGKEAIRQTTFQWQTDRLPKAVSTNAQKEGSKNLTDSDCIPTEVKENNTQIFRRGAAVSDTANVVQYYGRGQEVGYQLEKAALELRRDMEKAFLWQRGSTKAAGSTAPKTAGFVGLVATLNATDPTPGGSGANKKGWNKLATIQGLTDAQEKLSYQDPDTGAAIAFETEHQGVSEDDLFQMTYNLYLANSKANVIMFHPKHASFFSSLMAGGASRMKVFDALDDEYNAEVDTIVDPLGQRYALVPNRLMPEGYIYFFNPSDWTQMVLRAPKKIQLAKQGSLQEWMIEAEVGLRHRNPYASGILKIATA